MPSVRKPIRPSAIAKKAHITKVGFLLMCEQGYHNTTCIDIAKASAVSTGAIYQYFTDKHDIFLAGLEDYADSILSPALKLIESSLSISNLEKTLSTLIDASIKNHHIKKTAHDELMAMSHLDPDVARFFHAHELKTTEAVAKLCLSAGLNPPHLKERIHIALHLIDDFCHEIVYHKHQNVDYPAMKAEIIAIISRLLTS